VKKYTKTFLALLLATLLCIGAFPGAMAATPPEDAANKLQTLGLFQGYADGSFRLKSDITRSEAVTLFVRLIGKETLAYAREWPTPFTDVQSWVAPIVGYAYAHGLTNGKSATLFGSNEPVTATQYLTFVLRALGYESGKDFEWDSAWTLTDQLGITNGEYNSGNNKSFKRGDAASVSFDALKAVNKATGEPLFESLLESGAIKREATESVGLVSSKPISNKPPLTVLPPAPKDGVVSYTGDTISLEITTYYLNWRDIGGGIHVNYYSIIKNIGEVPVALRIDDKEFDANGNLAGVSNWPYNVNCLGSEEYHASTGELSYNYSKGGALERTITATAPDEWAVAVDTSKLSLTNKRVDGKELVTVTNNSGEEMPPFLISGFYFLDDEFVEYSATRCEPITVGGNSILELSAPSAYDGVLFMFSAL
jgi:hypothetical protein